MDVRSKVGHSFAVSANIYEMNTQAVCVFISVIQFVMGIVSSLISAMLYALLNLCVLQR